MINHKQIRKAALLLMMAALPMGYTSCATAEASEASGYVYICTGPKAKVYHTTPNCSGLNKCSSSVKKVPRSSTNRRACRKCG